MGNELIAYRTLKKNTAITLIELLIVVILISLVFVGGISAMVTIMQFLKVETTESVATENLANTLEWIKKDAMCAEEATVKVDGIEFIVDGSTTVAFYTIGSNLYRRVDGGTGQLITDMIDTSYLPSFIIPAGKINFISFGIWIKDPNTGGSAHCWTGVMLRCSPTM
jgi:type II secretory pathway pseudopilin PulG